eukprot:6847035-Pyramimonas_sp.AAC.1
MCIRDSPGTAPRPAPSSRRERDSMVPRPASVQLAAALHAATREQAPHSPSQRSLGGRPARPLVARRVPAPPASRPPAPLPRGPPHAVHPAAAERA